MKNRIFAIVLVILLSLPISVSAVDNDLIPSVEQVETLPELENSVLEEELSQINGDALSSDYKQPVSIKKITKKFGFAMLGVMVSSFLIFFGLTLYNRVRETILNKVKTPEGETPLSTPENLTDAVRVFLEKTRW